MDVRRLETLLLLSRLGSMRAVADETHTTTSAVSQQIATLAREAGTALIEPEGRRVRLTPAGRRLAGHAVTILAAVEAARLDLDPSAEPTGTLRVAGFGTAIRRSLMPVLSRLAADHPKVRVHIHEHEPAEALSLIATDDIDLALTYDYNLAPTTLDRSMVSQPLWSTEWALGVPATDLLPAAPTSARPSPVTGTLAADSTSSRPSPVTGTLAAGSASSRLSAEPLATEPVFSHPSGGPLATDSDSSRPSAEPLAAGSVFSRSSAGSLAAGPASHRASDGPTVCSASPSAEPLTADLVADGPDAGDPEHAAPAVLARYRDHDWIVNSRGAADEQVVRTIASMAGFEPLITHRADSLALLQDLVVAGLGIGLLPADQPTRPGVRLLPLRNPCPILRTSAVVRAGRTDWPPLALLLNLLRTVPAQT